MTLAEAEPRKGDRPPVDPASILGAIPDPVLVLGPRDEILYCNQGAEQFFAASAALLHGQGLADLLAGDSPVFALVAQARRNGSSVSEAGVTLNGPRIGSRFVAIDAAPLAEDDAHVVVSFHEQSIARRIDRQLTHRNSARSVTAMAAMLAHEVKNPLSGIRGAAQLLEQGAAAGDRELTRLICDETDRIAALVDRMELFADDRPLERHAVNIHEVLGHVRRLARSGFARHVRITERYDPSLPPVYGNRDQLVQALLNLVKNAAEAVPRDGGEIVLSSAFRQGFRLAVPGSDSRVHLPLVISVRDNGPGVPEDLRAHLFDPFVTTKAEGSGLGLALVAKIVGDHGGVVDIECQPRRTEFRIMLPVHPEQRDGSP